MKLEVREDTDVALPLMESVLSKGQPLDREYPQIFAPGSDGRVVVALEDEDVRSACAILTRELVFPDATGNQQRIRVGLIGSVSTAANSRRRGMAKAVLDLAEQELRAEGCLFSLLWADDPKVYAARGYKPVGLEVDFILEKALTRELPVSTHVRSALPGDFSRLHELYLGHQRRMERGAFESASLFATPGMQLFVHDNGEGPSAYACMGRGHDLDGVVHEWAGETNGVLACLRAHLEADVLKERNSPIFMMAPGGPDAVSERLHELGAPSAAGILALGKILDVEGAAELVAQSGASLLGIQWQTNGEVEFDLKGKTATISMEHWMEILMPAKGECSRLERLERQLGTRIEGLPWMPFLWGLDSI